MRNKHKTEMLENLYSYFKTETGEDKSRYERYFLMLDTINNLQKTAIYIYNRELKIVYANDMTLALTKLSWTEIREKNYDWLCNHYHCQDMKIKNLRKNLMDRGEAFEVYLRYETGKGEYCLLKVRNAQLKLENDYAEDLFIGEASLFDCYNYANDEIKQITDELSYSRHNSFLNQFSQRESEVIQNMYYRCLKAPELADYMHLSANTISTHMSNIYKKLEINNSIQLVKLMAHNLLPDEKVVNRKS